MRSIVVAGFALCVALLLPLAGALARESTPIVPLAAECDGPQIPLDRLEFFSGSPFPTDPADMATPAPMDLPDGDAPSEDDLAAIYETILGVVACINAGDNLRALDFYADSFLEGLFRGLKITQEMYDQETGNIVPRPAGQELVIVGFGDAVVLENGEVMILVFGDDRSQPEGPSGTIFHLVNAGDRWLVVETIETTEEVP